MCVFVRNGIVSSFVFCACYDVKATKFLWERNTILHEWSIAKESDLSQPKDENLTTCIFEADTFIPIAKLQVPAATVLSPPPGNFLR